MLVFATVNSLDVTAAATATASLQQRDGNHDCGGDLVSGDSSADSVTFTPGSGYAIENWFRRAQS